MDHVDALINVFQTAQSNGANAKLSEGFRKAQRGRDE